MEICVYQDNSLSKLLKAYFLEKKLTKSLINSSDIPTLTLDLSNSIEKIPLRQSAQLLIGLLRIFHHKFVIILSEIEEFFKSFEKTPKKPLKPGKTLPTQLITMNPKQSLMTFDDNFSVKSFVSSTRDSIETPRNQADINSITINEVNFTPKSIKSFPELDDAGSVMEIDSPLLDFQELEPEIIQTPGLSVKMNTPARSIQRRKAKIRVNNKTTLDNSLKALNKREHLRLKPQEMSLNSDELFKKPVLYVPEDILTAINEVKVETFEFGNEAVDGLTYEYENNDNIDKYEQLDEVEKLSQEKSENNEDSKRCEIILNQVKNTKGRTKFSKFEMRDRKEAGQTLYSLLVLTNQGQVKMEQKGFNREIFISFLKV